MEGTCRECVFPLSKEDSSGTCPTDTSLIYAAGKGNISCVKELIAAGADVNATCECHGNGALQMYVADDQVEYVEELIAAGADVNVINKDGDAVLLHAAIKGNVHIVKKLISAGD